MKGLMTGAVVAAALLVAAPAAPAAGGRLAFTQGTGGIATVAPGGGTPTQVVPAGSLPAWSPDGRQLAYISGSAVYVASATGAGARKVATLPTAVGGGSGAALPAGGPPAWSPNGRRVAFANDGVVQVVSATGGRPTTVVSLQRPSGFVDEASHPVWSHDGRTLYYLAVDQTLSVERPLYTVAALSLAKGATLRQVPLGWPAGGWSLTPYTLSISPSGRTLAVTAGRDADGTAPPAALAVGLVAVSGGAVTLLPGFSAASFSPTGRQLCVGAGGALSVITLGGGVVSTPVPASAAPVACAWQP